MASDADDQIGGTGGEHGPDPATVEPGRDNAAPKAAAAKRAGRQKNDESHEKGDDFPASDPPGNY